MAIERKDCEALYLEYSEKCRKARGPKIADIYWEVAVDLKRVLDGKQTFAWVYRLYYDKRTAETDERKAAIYQEAFMKFKEKWID